MLTFREYLAEQLEKGTYAAVLPSNDDKQLLAAFVVKHDLTNDDPLHCTLLYSKKYLPNFNANPALLHKARIIKFEVWPKKDSNENYLVVLLDCESLQNRYNALMSEHKATSDYDEYTPHITLACEAKPFDAKDYDLNELPKIIILTNEYKEDLDLREVE